MHLDERAHRTGPHSRARLACARSIAIADALAVALAIADALAVALAIAVALGGSASAHPAPQEVGSVPGTDAPPPEPPPAEDPALGASDAGPVFHGYITVRNRLRWSSDETDDDLLVLGGIDVGDPETDHWTFHVLARAAVDVDGLASGGDEFQELTDTYDSSLNGHVYHAYADAHRVDALDVFRLGRQDVVDTPTLVTFDGVRVDTAEHGELGLQAGVYGGVPVHHYESSPSGDAVVGAFGALRPWTGGRVRFDWLHLEDEVALGEHRDDLLGLRLWQAAGEQLWIEAGGTMLEGNGRDAGLRATWTDPERDLVVLASHYELLDTQKAQANELDPFFDALLEYFPYGQTELSIAKGFSERVTAQAGATLRRVRDEDDVGQFNRDFERYFLSVGMAELVFGAALTLTGDLWNSPDADAHSLGADLTREIDDRMRASLGTYYALYKDDFFFDEERHDARTWYLKARRQVSDACSLEAAYEYEDSDLGWFQTLRVGATWRY